MSTVNNVISNVMPIIWAAIALMEWMTAEEKEDAIKAADKPPNAVRETVENMRREANKRGFEVFGRIKLRDMKTGKIYR